MLKTICGKSPGEMLILLIKWADLVATNKGIFQDSEWRETMVMGSDIKEHKN